MYQPAEAIAADMLAGRLKVPTATHDPRDAEIARLRQAMAEMQDDLDAAHRLLGLAPYPLTA